MSRGQILHALITDHDVSVSDFQQELLRQVCYAMLSVLRKGTMLQIIAAAEIDWVTEEEIERNCPS